MVFTFGSEWCSASLRNAVQLGRNTHLGNPGRDIVIGPGLATWDLSFFKDTPLREKMNGQFRAELFNLLNRANFNTPNAVAFTPAGVSPTAGVITSTSTTSRQIQCGMKLVW